LQHGEQVYVCERENPQALKDAILALRDDPDLRTRLALNGYKFYQQNLSFAALGRRLTSILEEWIRSK
jgi:glycosyltransferase involved in cell wall biosynthesis